MKKLFIGMTAAGLLALSAASFAATTPPIDFPITVTVITTLIAIEGNSNTWEAESRNFGVIGNTTSACSNKPAWDPISLKGDSNEPYIQITNRGSSTIQLGVQQASGTAPSAWQALLNGTPGTLAGTNQYRLSGVFTNYFGNLQAATQAIGPTANDGDWERLTSYSFGTEDIITTSTQWANDTLFYVNGLVTNAPTAGWHIAPAVPLYIGQRQLRFCLDPPSSITVGEGIQQTITVTVIAQAE